MLLNQQSKPLLYCDHIKLIKQVIVYVYIYSFVIIQITQIQLRYSQATLS